MRQAIINNDAGSKVHFYNSSGGNAGLACATAAHTLGRPATIVVPQKTAALMVAKIKTAGASEVIRHGESWAEADEFLRKEILANDPGGIYVPPFDHQNVWDGAASIIEELVDKPDAVVCSVGGGGLFCGLQLGLERNGWGDVEVLAMETHGADSLAKSLQEGELVTLEAITSVTTGLGAKRVAEKTFELAQRKNVTSAVLSDAEAAMGSWRLADDERLMVEPACGVNVAPCYNGKLKKLLPNLHEASKAVIILCGGSNITLDGLVELRTRFGDIETTTIDSEDVPSSRSIPSIPSI